MPSNREEREEKRYIAKLSEQAERYDEMAKCMEDVAKCASLENEDLSNEERRMLCVAFKNQIGQRRAAWRIISIVSKQEKKKETNSTRAMTIVQNYQTRINDELDEISDRVLKLLDEVLIPRLEKKEKDIDFESLVFYHKMKADYLRYKIEYNLETHDAASLAQDTLKAYQRAKEIALLNLPVTHPIRLGLLLNVSVFYHDILNEPEEAIKISQQTFEESIVELEHCSEDVYKDATTILQLLRDNYNLWTKTIEENNVNEST